MRTILGGVLALALVGAGFAVREAASRSPSATGDAQAAQPMAGAAIAVPRRVVSINPCADAIVLQVADPAQVAAISHYSHDPEATSVPLDQAMKFAVTQDSAEEVMALKPDLVIAGAHVAGPTMMMLRRLGIRVLQVPVPQSIAQSQEQVAQIATAMGHGARGRALNARIDAALLAARPQDRRAVPALLWQAGGMVPGAGTLADELLTRTGFANRSAAYGLQMWDVLSLERLLADPPALLLTSGAMAEHGDRQLRHPALARLSRKIEIREFAPRLLHCAGPTLIPAAARLADLRRDMGA